MAKAFREVLEIIAAKTGLDLKNPALADLLAINTTVDDAVFTQIQTGLNGLFTIDAAKNNSDLKKYYHAQAYNGMDAVVESILANQEFGFDDTIRTEIKGIEKTTEKLPALIKKVKELESKKAGASKGDAAELNKRIEELNNQIIASKKSAEDQINQVKLSHNNELLDFALKNHLANFNYANDQLPKDINVLTAHNLLQKEAANKKVLFVRDANNNIILKPSDNPEMDYFENNQKVSFEAFTNGVLANNKMLKVSDPARVNPPIPVPGAPEPNVELVNFYDQQLGKLAPTQN